MGDAIQAVERTFEVVDALLELDGAGVTELAEHVGISVSGMYKHLATLRGLGYVEKRDGKYEVTNQFYSLGQRVRMKDPLYEVSRTPLDQLAQLTYARANLYVRENGRVVCLYSTSGGQDLSTESSEGRTLALEDGVAGRVTLSREADEKSQNSGSDGIEGGLTVVNDRQVGVETEGQHRRIAIAILDSERAIGSIEVFAPADRIEGRLVDEDILSMMVSTAETIDGYL